MNRKNVLSMAMVLLMFCPSWSFAAEEHERGEGGVVIIRENSEGGGSGGYYGEEGESYRFSGRVCIATNAAGRSFVGRANGMGMMNSRHRACRRALRRCQFYSGLLASSCMVGSRYYY